MDRERDGIHCLHFAKSISKHMNNVPNLLQIVQSKSRAKLHRIVRCQRPRLVPRDCNGDFMHEPDSFNTQFLYLTLSYALSNHFVNPLSVLMLHERSSVTIETCSATRNDSDIETTRDRKQQRFPRVFATCCPLSKVCRV
jgi:hypothetical protein